jgi:hypothetical protein
MNLTEQISAITGIVGDTEYELKAARNPKKKRAAQHTRDFFKSILESLLELNNLKNAQ